MLSGDLDPRREEEQPGSANLSDLDGPKSPYQGATVVTQEDLTLEHLRTLLSGDTLAVVVPGFVTPSSAEKIGQRLEDLPLRSKYRNLKDALFKIGEIILPRLD